MVLKQSKFGLTALLLLLAFILGACGGTLPTELPSDLELQIEDGVEELEFSGEIQEMGPESWTVAGVSFLIDSGTEIQPGLALGDEVKVHAQLNAEDELTAREIEALSAKDTDLSDDDDRDETEFTGPVESIGAESWVIGGTTVAVSSSTEIKGDLQIGDLAKVHASMVDGVLTAREIEPAEDDDLDEADDEDEFFGTVESISDGSWVIGGRTVAVTSSTEIKGNLQVGDLVKVHASMVDGVLTAREIEPAEEDDLDDDDDKDEFVGILEAIDGDVWTIGGRAFTISSATEIEDNLQIGDLVEVELKTDSAGSVFVEEIELADDDLDDDSDNDFDDDHDEDEDDDDEHDEAEEDDDDENDDDNSGSGSDDHDEGDDD